MKSKIMAIVLIVSLAINIGVVSIVLCRGMMVKKFWGRGPMVMGRMHALPFSRKLGLTKEQEEKIVKFQEEMQKNILPLRKNLDAKRKELFAMVKSGKVDEKKKQSILKETAVLQMQIENIALDNIVRIRNIMTPEQAEKMNKSFEKIESRFFCGDTFTGPHMPGPRKFGR